VRDGYHLTDLIRRPEVHINLDWQQMGVGGDDSWKAKTLAKYSLPFRPMSVSFILKPLDNGQEIWTRYKQPF
jgi:beta-galactosidase